MRFEVLTAASMKMAVFLVVAAGCVGLVFKPVKGGSGSGGSGDPQTHLATPHAPAPPLNLAKTQPPHPAATTKKTAIFILAAVRTSNLIMCFLLR
jgi:hypothetical protein